MLQVNLGITIIKYSMKNRCSFSDLLKITFNRIIKKKKQFEWVLVDL